MATGTIKSNGWKTLVVNQAVSTALSYPSEFNELLIICNETDSNITLELLIASTMKNSGRSLRTGYYITTNSFTSFLATLSTTIGLSYFKNGSQITSPKISAYYR